MHETPHAPDTEMLPHQRLETLISAFTKQMDTEIREAFRLAAAIKKHEGTGGDFGFDDDLEAQLQKMKAYYDEALAKTLELGEAAVPENTPQQDLPLR